MMEFVNTHAEQVGFNPSARSHIELAAEEVLVNIISHAYKGTDIEDPCIHIECHLIKNEELKVVVKDKGKPFNPLEASRECPEGNKNLELGLPVIGGYGIFLIFQMMDRVEYLYEDGMNVLHLTKFHQSKS
jgi:anti-sigma regulatory factor (Ser/Thr protein kinase)